MGKRRLIHSLFPCPVSGRNAVFWPDTAERLAGSIPKPYMLVQYCNNILFLCIFLLFKRTLVAQGGKIPGSPGIRLVHIVISVLILWCFLEIFMVCAMPWALLAG